MSGAQGILWFMRAATLRARTCSWCAMIQLKAACSGGFRQLNAGHHCHDSPTPQDGIRDSTNTEQLVRGRVVMMTS